MVAAAPVLIAAREYLAAGLSVIPVFADGSKRPVESGWNQYSGKRASERDLVKWFGNGTIRGVGICGGRASGNLAVLDFELGSAYDAWRAIAPADTVDMLSGCPIIRTPSGGYHVWVRLPESVPGTVLARRPDPDDPKRGKVLIEIRGDGHQVLAPGCPASCHRTGKLYEFVDRGWLDSQAGPTPIGVWEEWCRLAAALSEWPPQSQTAQRSPHPQGEQIDVFKRFNQETTLKTVVEWHVDRRHRVIHRSPDCIIFARDGKKESDQSFNVKLIDGVAITYCFSTNAGMPTNAGLSPAQVRCYYETGSCDTAAMKAFAGKLRQELGIEEPQKSRKEQSSRQQSAAGPQQKETAPRWPAPVPISQLSGDGPAVDWFMNGMLAAGHITLLSAFHKTGKTTLISHMLRCLQTGQPFIGRETRECRTLFISEESEKLW
ncbi:MAG TPA: bifunctional DNA primase/polymerase, partial [Gemmataceae bacterium]